MFVTSSEFKTNVSKYLKQSSIEDIIITRNGKIIARVTRPIPEKDKLSLLDSLVGVAPEEGYYNDMEVERLKRQ